MEVVIGLNKSSSKQLTIFINHLKLIFVDKRDETSQKIATETKKSNKRRNNQAQEFNHWVLQRRAPLLLSIADIGTI